MRSMLLQVLYSVRSEHQLVERISYNLLFRWFVGLAIEDTVWNHSVFSKNRDRLIEQDTVTELFNSTVDIATKKGLLSDDRPPEDWHGQPRSNDTHESKTDPESRLYRKSNAAPALPSYLGHVLTDNLHGLVVNVKSSASNGRAERELAVQMLAEVAKLGKRVTVSADKAYDTRGFVQACRELNVTPHVAQHTRRNGGSAIDGRTHRHPGYAISQRKRKCIEQCFGWGKLIGPMRQVMMHGLDKVDHLLTLTMAAYNLTRLRSLTNLRPQYA